MEEFLAKARDFVRQTDFPAFLEGPAIVEFFQGYSVKIESKAALARVADAMLPVDVVLLAAYGLASWTSSRRGTPAQIETSWDWHSKASVALTIMISRAEFVVLGNRPGIVPMVTGSVLLVSALLTVRNRN